MRNSLDAVADRDFALDYLYAVAVLFTHLSRIGEELVLWTTREFGFARLPEVAATGSSMMPQKLNPDVAELARGKAGTAIGRLTGLLATIKGLPLAYDRDLQEDKPPVFAARRDVRRRARRARRPRRRASSSTASGLPPRASDPLLLRDGRRRGARRARAVPFRDAHEQVAASVRAGTFDPPARRAAARRTSQLPSRQRGHDGRAQRTEPTELGGRDLLRIADLAPAEAEAILDLAAELKATRRQPLLPGATLGLYFAKHSTRTRVSFSVAMAHLGGSAVAADARRAAVLAWRVAA